MFGTLGQGFASSTIIPAVAQITQVVPARIERYGKHMQVHVSSFQHVLQLKAMIKHVLSTVPSRCLPSLAFPLIFLPKVDKTFFLDNQFEILTSTVRLQLKCSVTAMRRVLDPPANMAPQQGTSLVLRLSTSLPYKA
jgi:hypothetical protein